MLWFNMEKNVPLTCKLFCFFNMYLKYFTIAMKHQLVVTKVGLCSFLLFIFSNKSLPSNTTSAISSRKMVFYSSCIVIVRHRLPFFCLFWNFFFFFSRECLLPDQHSCLLAVALWHDSGTLSVKQFRLRRSEPGVTLQRHLGNVAATACLFAHFLKSQVQTVCLCLRDAWVRTCDSSAAQHVSCLEAERPAEWKPLRPPSADLSADAQPAPSVFLRPTLSGARGKKKGKKKKKQRLTAESLMAT